MDQLLWFFAINVLSCVFAYNVWHAFPRPVTNRSESGSDVKSNGHAIDQPDIN